MTRPLSLSMTAPTKVAFVSGPIAPPPTYFEEHYEGLLRAAIASGYSFVMGPAPGIDTLALRFLVDQGVNPAKITVYLAEFQERIYRSSLEWLEGLGGHIHVEGVTTSDRDAAMTRASDYDILRYMTVQEQMAHYGEDYYPRISATQMNERRRQGLPLYRHDPDDSVSGTILAPSQGPIVAGSVRNNQATAVASRGIRGFFARFRKASEVN